MIIDFHTHIFPPSIRDRREDYLKRDPAFGEMYSSPRAKLITADELVAAMNEAGIDRSVVLNVGWADHELCVETNSYILESVARYPRRLDGFCAVQPAAGDRALREIERCARAGARGIGEIRPDRQGLDPDDASTMAALAQVLTQHNMLFLCHSSEPVGHVYSGKGRVTPDFLVRLISALPGVTVICAHWGGGLPFYALMPEVGEILKNTYFDTAASPFLYHSRVYTVVSELVGADRILMGTDYPLMKQGRVVREIESSGLGRHAVGAILGGNAARLLGAGPQVSR